MCFTNNGIISGGGGGGGGGGGHAKTHFLMVWIDGGGGGGGWPYGQGGLGNGTEFANGEVVFSALGIINKRRLKVVQVVDRVLVAILDKVAQVGLVADWDKMVMLAEQE